MIGAVLLAIVGIVKYRAEGFLAATWVFAPLFPPIAAVVSVVAYLVAQEDSAHAGIPQHPIDAVYLGIAAAAFGWMLSAFPGAQLARRDRAQMRVYQDLLQRHRVLAARVGSEMHTSKKSNTAPTKALCEASAVLSDVGHQLVGAESAGPALRWVLANGYSNIARELHRAEEALIVIESDAEIVGDALHDDLSLEDSGLKNRFTLRRVIRDAMPAISEAAADSLLRPVPALPQTAALLARAQAATKPLSKDEAREALREVRFAINDYRDDIIDSFARGRNRVIWTFLAVSLTTYVMLGLGLLGGLPKGALVTVSALYLIGSLVGLFSRLRIESSRPSTNEDYGLYLARLLTGPLLSGLAGVAGVYLVAQAPALLGPVAEIGSTSASPAPLPSPSPAEAIAAAANEAVQPKSLAEIYDLAANRLAPAVSAVFGLTPGLLTARLQQQVDRLERDLQRSEPATSTAVAGAAPEGSGEVGQG
jgi:hypothetical protein